MGLDPLAWLAGLRRRVARVQGMLATGYPPIAASRTRPGLDLKQPSSDSLGWPQRTSNIRGRSPASNCNSCCGKRTGQDPLSRSTIQQRFST
jgi:hypothetical protein